MTVKPKPMSVRTKRGDDFRLQMAVRDRNNEDAVAAYVDYQAAYEDWRDAVNADPPVDATIAAKLVLSDAALETYEGLCVVDITNWEIKCGIAWGGKTYAIGEVTIEDVDTGIYSIYLSKEITYWLKPRTYQLEVQFTRPDGDVISSADMLFIVDADIVDSEEFDNMEPPPISVPGPQGPTGPKGDTGDVGPKGDTGDNGVNGVDGTDGVDGQDYNVLTNKTVSASTYTMINSDFLGNTQISFTAANVVITIPSGLTNMEPVALIQVGTGQASIVAGGGVTLISSYGFNFAGQGAVCGLMKRDTDSYVFVGDMVA